MAEEGRRARAEQRRQVAPSGEWPGLGAAQCRPMAQKVMATVMGQGQEAPETGRQRTGIYRMDLERVRDAPTGDAQRSEVELHQADSRYRPHALQTARPASREKLTTIAVG